MNILLEGLFFLFGVPVVIVIIGLCWGLVFVGAWELYSKVDKWFEGRKAKPESTKKEQKTLNGDVYNYTIDGFK